MLRQQVLPPIPPQIRLTLRTLVANATVVKKVQCKSGKCMFIDAPGVSGKTFFEMLILAAVRSNGAIALAETSSGIVAILMNG